MVPTGMASGAIGHVGQILAPFHGIGCVQLRDWSGNRLRQIGVIHSSPERDFRLGQRIVNGRQGPQIHHHRSHIFVAKIMECHVPHLGMQHAPVMSDSLADRTRNHVVGPPAVTSLCIGGQIWRDQPRLAIFAKDMPCPLLPCGGRGSGRIPVAVGMAAKTSQHRVRQVLAASAAFICAFEFHIAERSLSRPHNIGVPGRGIDLPPHHHSWDCKRTDQNDGHDQPADVFPFHGPELNTN